MIIQRGEKHTHTHTHKSLMLQIHTTKLIFVIMSNVKNCSPIHIVNFNSHNDTTHNTISNVLEGNFL